MTFPLVLIAGWIGIALVVFYVFGSDFLLVLLNGVLLAGAWWLVARPETTLLQRIVGGSLLGMFVLGLILAYQTQILPGLEGNVSPEERIHDMMQVLIQRSSPHTFQMSRRMKTISIAVYVVHATVVVPLALCVPPLLGWRQQRKLGGPRYLSQSQAIVGLVILPLLLAGLAWVSWPTVRQWADTPASALGPNPFGLPVGPFPPQLPNNEDNPG
jgi:hypothetical protein